MKILVYGSALLSTHLVPCIESAGHHIISNPAQQPDLIIGLNELEQSAALSLNLKKPMVVWFTDNHRFQSKNAPEFLKQNSFMFCFSKSQQEWFNEAGWRHSYYLPLAVDTKTFKPLQKTTKISFMGELRHMTSDSAMVQLLHPLRLKADPKTTLGQELGKFFEYIERFIIEKCCLLQPVNRSRLYEDFHKCCPTAFHKYIELFNQSLWEDALFENYNAILRAKVCRELKDDLDIWGTFNDWNTLGDWPGHHQRRAVYPHEWSEICGKSNIGLNLFRPDPMHGIPLKAFEIAACSVLLTNDHPMLRTVFTPDTDCMVFNSFDEAKEKYAYLMSNPDVLQKLSKNSRELMDKKHQYSHRWHFMEKCFKETGVIKNQEISI